MRSLFDCWRDGQAYAPLVDLDRAGLAWEWLRRVPDYGEVVAARGVPTPSSGPPIQVESAPWAAGRWGLHFRRTN